MPKFNIHFAYGGKYTGDHKNTVEIEGKNEEDALINFKKAYLYEIIYSCKAASDNKDSCNLC